MKSPLLRFIFRKLAIRGPVIFPGSCWVNWTSRIWSQNGLVFGNHVYVGKHCTIEVDGRIGSGVMIANRVGIIGRRDHDVRHLGAWATLAPWIGDGTYRSANNSIMIDDDVWIGYGATVLSGITIGRGAIIGAGAVVTNDVPAYTVVVGNPAHPIGTRFPTEQIPEHERLIMTTGGRGTHSASRRIL